MESINGSLTRLQTDYVDLYQAHRYDYETPLEETMQAFADVVRQGKVLYIGVSEWTAEQIRDGHALAKELGIQLISNQPQYSMLWRVIEDEVVPTSRGARHLADRLVARSRRACSPASTCPVSRRPRARARPTRRAAPTSIKRLHATTTCSTAVQRLKPIADEAGLTMAQLAVAWVLQNPNVAAALVGASRPEQVADTVKASGVKLDADTHGRDRRRRSAASPSPTPRTPTRSRRRSVRESDASKAERP